MDNNFEEQTFWSKFKDNIIDLIQFLAIVLAIFVVLRFFIAEPHKVFGLSMVPNFHDGDYIITNKLAARFSEPQRGEVIILQNPRDNSQVFIKRVIGLPGEQIKVSNGQVYINSEVLSEPYLPSGTNTQGGAYLSEEEEVTVPDNQYFVMGDNRGGSSDSREWGPISKDLIVGQAWLRYWPLKAFTLIKIDEPSR